MRKMSTLVSLQIKMRNLKNIGSRKIIGVRETSMVTKSMEERSGGLEHRQHIRIIRQISPSL